MTSPPALLLLLLLLPRATSQQVASSPAVLQFALLTKEVPGTLRETAVDITGNLYAAGRDVSSAFVSKRSPSLTRLWATRLPSLPNAFPALAFSDTGGLFAIAARLPTDLPTATPTATPSASVFSPPDSPPLADVILYELDTLSGDILSSALVERVQLSSNSPVKCILASATAPDPPFVYVTYIVQDGVAPSTARTRVVQMVRVQSGALARSWTRVITNRGRTATSVGIAEDKANGRVVVVEVSSNGSSGLTDQLASHALGPDGGTLHMAKMETASRSAWISDIETDENGSLYIGEGPNLLHRVALRALDGEDLLAKLWNVTETEVVDMVVLKNGTAIYVLSNGEGFRNEGTQVVRTNTPILSIYNASGHSLFKSEYRESTPDAERELYSLSLINPENSCHAVLGGFLRLAGELAVEEEVSIGLFTFPNVAKESKGPENSQVPVLIDPNSPVTAEPQNNTTLLVIGASVGVFVFLCIIAVALFIIYRKNDRAETREAHSDTELVAMKTDRNNPLRDNNILV